jgi:hypothetical protein
MVEHVRWDNETVHVSTDRIRMDLFYLLSMVFASDRFYRLPENSAATKLFYMFEESEIHHRLIRIAITVRILQERGEKHGWFHSRSRDCGELWPDVDRPAQTNSLDLREACNKIIHGTTVRLDFDDLERPSRQEPFIFIYAKRGKSNWRARLDLLQFANHVEYLLVQKEIRDNAA